MKQAKTKAQVLAPAWTTYTIPWFLSVAQGHCTITFIATPTSPITWDMDKSCLCPTNHQLQEHWLLAYSRMALRPQLSCWELACCLSLWPRDWRRFKGELSLFHSLPIAYINKKPPFWAEWIQLKTQSLNQFSLCKYLTQKSNYLGWHIWVLLYAIGWN